MFLNKGTLHQLNWQLVNPKFVNRALKTAEPAYGLQQYMLLASQCSHEQLSMTTCTSGA